MLNTALGLEVVEYEEMVEKQVLEPLTKLLKEDFSHIAKQRKALKQVNKHLYLGCL